MPENLDTRLLPDYLNPATYHSFWYRTSQVDKFPPLSWNAYDRHFYMNRTNNFVESWIKKSSIVLGHSNLTIYNFISALQMEQSSIDAQMDRLWPTWFERCRLGGFRKRSHSDKDRRIQCIVENYHTYENDVLS
jgi:hypothetical protein